MYTDEVSVRHSDASLISYAAAGTDRSQRMGGADDPALALRKATDIGMEPNNAGQRMNLLETYEPDVLSKDMQSVLSYGVSLLPGK